MKRTAFGLAVAAVLILTSMAQAGGGLTVSGAWSRPTAPGAPTAVGYLTVANHGRQADRLLSVDSQSAANVTLHSMSMTGGIMRMRRLVGGLENAPGGSLSLDPNGDHIMFEGLKRPFKAGDQVGAILHFRHAGAIKVQFVVGAGPAPMTMH